MAKYTFKVAAADTNRDCAVMNRMISSLAGRTGLNPRVAASLTYALMPGQYVFQVLGATDKDTKSLASEVNWSMCASSARTEHIRGMSHGGLSTGCSLLMHVPAGSTQVMPE